MVASSSTITFDEYVAFYRRLQGTYGNLPTSDRVFGSPDSFYEVIEPERLLYAKNVEGGIATQEPGLDMLGLRATVVNRLTQSGTTISCNSNVAEATEENDGFRLVIDGPEQVEHKKFSQVINAGGYLACELDRHFGDETKYTLQLKSWTLFERRGDSVELPPFYVVHGDFIHHAPLMGSDLSSLIMANNSGSYIDSITLAANQSGPPDE